MNVLKRIKKRKQILKNSHTIHQIPMVSEVDVIQLDSQSIHLSGQFEFIVVNGYVTMDLFTVKSPRIYKFNSNVPVNVVGHNTDFNLEEYLSTFQQQQQCTTYRKMLNYLLTNYNTNAPIMLVVGEYKRWSYGKVISEQKMEVFDRECQNVMIMGDKGSGKSTTVQLYANQLLNNSKVYILDCDIGQSLVLPGFVHLLRLELPMFLSDPEVIYQGFVGEFSVHNYFDNYFDNISRAHQAYNEAQLMRDYPLITNTAGFISSYGVSILQETINIVKPTITIILSQTNIKSQVNKSRNLITQLPTSSFLNNSMTWKTEYVDLQEDLEFDVEQKQSISQLTNPQSKRQNRSIAIAKALGIPNLQYLTLCNADYQIWDISKCHLQILKCMDQFTDALEIARAFCLSLVAIEQNYKTLGIGFIRDVDIPNQQIHIITQIVIDSALPIYIIKSKHYEISKEYQTISENDVQQFCDTQQIMNGLPLELDIEIPYFQEKSEAIGDIRYKPRINQKQFK